MSSSVAAEGRAKPLRDIPSAPEWTATFPTSLPAIPAASGFSDGVSYQTLENVAPTSVWTQHGYPSEYSVAPRLWLGYQVEEGMGVRLRYWQFDQQLMDQSVTTTATTTVFFDGLIATGGEILAFGSGMELHVIDLDVTKAFEGRYGTVTAGVGLRYASLQFDYAGALSSGAGVLQEISVGENTFEGIGPSALFDFQAPIRQSRLSVVGGLRGSVLFGSGSDIEDVQEVVAPFTRTTVNERADRSTSVLEVSLGLQYDRQLSEGVDGFLRCAWEGQLWMDVGSPTYDSGDMTLQGLYVGAGITR